MILFCKYLNLRHDALNTSTNYQWQGLISHGWGGNTGKYFPELYPEQRQITWSPDQCNALCRPCYSLQAVNWITGGVNDGKIGDHCWLKPLTASSPFLYKGHVTRTRDARCFHRPTTSRATLVQHELQAPTVPNTTVYGQSCIMIINAEFIFFKSWWGRMCMTIMNTSSQF